MGHTVLAVGISDVGMPSSGSVTSERVLAVAMSPDWMNGVR